jgi:hypothetical protein
MVTKQRAWSTSTLVVVSSLTGSNMSVHSPRQSIQGVQRNENEMYLGMFDCFHSEPSLMIHITLRAYGGAGGRRERTASRSTIHPPNHTNNVDTGAGRKVRVQSTHLQEILRLVWVELGGHVSADLGLF